MDDSSQAVPGEEHPTPATSEVAVRETYAEVAGPSSAVIPQRRSPVIEMEERARTGVLASVSAKGARAVSMAAFDITLELGAALDRSLRGITTRLPAPHQAPAPSFVSLAALVQVRQQRQQLYGYTPAPSTSLDLAAGFTDARLTVRFVDFAAQWRPDGDYQVYLGGSIRVAIRLRIYADERTRPAARHACLALLMNHELLHLRDDIEIATGWLAAALERDAFVRGALTVGNRVRADRFASDIEGSGDGAGSYLERRIIQNVFLPEEFRRAAALHASHDIQRLSECLAARP